MERLTKRAEYRRAAGGSKWAAAAFVLQAREREVPGEGDARTGFTASRKVGNAVARNRARRRLKEAARVVLTAAARPGIDYVVIARRTAVSHPYQEILADLGRAIQMVHKKLDSRRRNRVAVTGQAVETGAS